MSAVALNKNHYQLEVSEVSSSKERNALIPVLQNWRKTASAQKQALSDSTLKLQERMGSCAIVCKNILDDLKSSTHLLSKDTLFVCKANNQVQAVAVASINGSIEIDSLVTNPLNISDSAGATSIPRIKGAGTRLMDHFFQMVVQDTTLTDIKLNSRISSYSFYEEKGFEIDPDGFFGLVISLILPAEKIRKTFEKSA